MTKPGKRPATPPSESVDDYLKAILDLGAGGGLVPTSALARRLAITPASVTGMLRKLATSEPPYVEYEKHRGTRLTGVGRQRALEIVRHHRLIERFLHDTLGYSWDEVHQEAEKLEHAISETFEDRIAAKLGDPDVDPHGQPIPRKDGTLPEVDETALLELASGSSAVVARVDDEDSAFLRHVAALGLVPGVRFTLESRGAFEGPLVVRVEGGSESRNVSRKVAREIFVTRVRPGGGA